MKQTNMCIHLEGIKIYAYHGVAMQERVVGNMFTVDLKLWCDFGEASRTDNLEYTVNYGEVFEAVKDEMRQPSQLLEAAAARIGSRLLNDFPQISKLHIRLSKTNPPMGADIASTGVSFDCER